MSGITFDLNLTGLDAAINKLNGVADLHITDLLDQVGGLVESQTRRRLEETKTAPDGTPWADWTDAYKKSRHSGHSVLDSDGSLIDSITFIVGSNEVSVGSNLIYAATHQYGREDDGIVARPYLGISPDDESEILDTINGFINEVLS